MQKFYNTFLNHLSAAEINPDAEQAEVLHAMAEYLPSRMFKPAKYSGIYIWGPPGRGKSMLMDTCMACFPGSKLRMHFHEFLRDVNRKLFEAKGNSEGLPPILSAWLKPYKLVCFDEFHVHDIADSVFVSFFLKTVIKEKKKVILTSNYEPDKLFPDSLYRASFLPTIALINEKFKIKSLIKHADYRMIKDLPDDSCFFPLDMKASIIKHLSTGDNALTEKNDAATLSGRLFNTFIQGEKTIGFEFAELCTADSSYLDYLELSEGYDTVFISDIKKEHLDRNAMMRFVWLLDVLYDRKIALYTTSEYNLTEMVQEHFSVNDSERCLSRLSEMRYGVHLKK